VVDEGLQRLDHVIYGPRDLHVGQQLDQFISFSIEAKAMFRRQPL
jgi:hypothetical protein